MKKFRVLIISLFFCIGLFGQSEKPYVLMISFDGFRADYLNWFDTPNFDRLAEQGVKAERMKPAFISKTFPNHYSLVTGLYVENHGLIANTFYDPKLELLYRISDRSKVEDPRFYGGEPIWVTAERQGVKSASFFWVGSEAPIGEIRPSIWMRYDHDLPFRARVDSVMNWFQLPESQRPHLALLYFHEPDAAGHEYGPKSEKTGQVVTKMDSLIGYLLDRAENLPIYGKLNIIVVSDHGMTDISPEQTINFADYTEMEGVIQEGTGPISFLYGVGIFRKYRIYRTLKKTPHISVYLKHRIPDRLHYRDHYRIKDLLVIADDGWSIVDSKNPKPEQWAGGNHGYDNELPSMHAIFIADGPAFKDGYNRGIFDNVNVYPLVAHILGLIPYPEIDGNLENVKDILR